MRADRHPEVPIYKKSSKARTLAFSVFGALTAGVLFPIGVNAQSTELPDDVGKSVVVNNCATCHGLDLITAKRRSPDEWDETVNRMIANGVVLDESQYDQVLAYLKKNLSTQTASGTAKSGQTLAKGPGSETSSQ